jgi:hypothetical protein
VDIIKVVVLLVRWVKGGSEARAKFAGIHREVDLLRTKVAMGDVGFMQIDSCLNDISEACLHRREAHISHLFELILQSPRGML